eukprot:m.411125 g.411125  ORF g.411125 m.411125 type:complete len:242 (+) comp56550_c0_seq3:384-1109(+)
MPAPLVERAQYLSTFYCLCLFVPAESCQNCEDAAATQQCAECCQSFCDECCAVLHKPVKKKAHQIYPLGAGRPPLALSKTSTNHSAGGSSKTLSLQETRSTASAHQPAPTDDGDGPVTTDPATCMYFSFLRMCGCVPSLFFRVTCSLSFFTTLLVIDWNPADVAAWINTLEPPFAQYSAAFERHKVRGRHLYRLTHALLERLGVSQQPHRDALLNHFIRLRLQYESTMIDRLMAQQPVRDP